MTGHMAKFLMRTYPSVMRRGSAVNTVARFYFGYDVKGIVKIGMNSIYGKFGGAA